MVVVIAFGSPSCRLLGSPADTPHGRQHNVRQFAVMPPDCGVY
ncbi:MAG: hypothetical protein ABF593_11880 [Acetobacter papayae]